MLKHYIVVLLVTVFCGSSVLAQYSAVQDEEQIYSYTFSQFGEETWRFVKQPAAWDAGDWLKVGLLGASVYVIAKTVDQPVRDVALANKQHKLSVPMEFGRVWGDIYAPVVLFGGFAGYSLLADDIGARKIAYEIGQASLYAGAVAFLLKFAIGRARPYLNEGPCSFYPFASFITQDYHSLPGGHNAAAFVLSTVLSRNAQPLWLKVLAYVPAALTFISRVYQDKHWTSDDFAGATIGYVIATWVVDQHESTESAVGVTSMFPLSISITF